MQKISKVASKIAGTLCGAITGISAGFIPGFYYFVEHGGGSFADGLFYLASLPFFVLWHMSKGAIEGAREGLMAGLTYPKTVNDSFITVKNNNKTHNALKNLLLRARFPSSAILTEQEKCEFQNILKQQISPEKRTQLEKDFATYQEYIGTIKCALTGRALKDIEKPLDIKVNNQSFVCEASAFTQLVEECQQKQIPISLSKTTKPSAKDIITYKHISVYSIASLPEAIANFINHTRKLFTSMRLINETLGVQSIANNTISAVTETPSNARNEFEEKTSPQTNNNGFATRTEETSSRCSQDSIVPAEQFRTAFKRT